MPAVDTRQGFFGTTWWSLPKNSVASPKRLPIRRCKTFYNGLQMQSCCRDPAGQHAALHFERPVLKS
jgi:hypothetical protein